MLILVPPGEIDSRFRRFSRLLYETLKQHHSILVVDVEQHSRGSIVCKVSAYFIKSIVHGATNGHSDRPTEFDRLDIFSNPFSVFSMRQGFQPLPNRLPAGFRPIENRWNSFFAFIQAGGSLYGNFRPAT